jgi:hypothetical protein
VIALYLHPPKTLSSGEDMPLTRDELEAAAALISTVGEWQRLGVKKAIWATCNDPQRAWEYLNQFGKYPSGTTLYDIHRGVMHWMEAAAKTLPKGSRIAL